MPSAKVRRAQHFDRSELQKMFSLLWPETPSEEHVVEIDTALHTGLTGTLPIAIFVSVNDEGTLTGFLQVGLRSHADGCDPAHPVGFIEGWFVQEDFRQRGIGAALMDASEDWARERGCREMASDAWITNELSQQAHQALGYEVVDRCVHFRKPL